VQADGPLLHAVLTASCSVACRSGVQLPNGFSQVYEAQDTQATPKKLIKAKNHVDDKTPLTGPVNCMDVECVKDDAVKRAYNAWPWLVPYLGRVPTGQPCTSNTCPSVWLRTAGWKGTIPPCAMGGL